jgi:hypothetical protein
MLLHERKVIITKTAALLNAAVNALAANPNTDYITPSFTFSADGSYGSRSRFGTTREPRRRTIA